MSILDIFENKRKRVSFGTAKLSNSSILTRSGAAIAGFLKLDMEHGPWMAGGSVRKCFLNQPIDFSDWDIFFNNEKQYQDARNLMESIDNGYQIYESKNAVTYQINVENEDDSRFQPPIKVQLIFRQYYNSYRDLLDDFDFTICQYVTDGSEYHLGETTYLDSVDRVIRLTSAHMVARPGFITRVIKYISYGYKPSRELLEYIESNNTDIDFSTQVQEYDF